jgi:hypothetical protein
METGDPFLKENELGFFYLVYDKGKRVSSKAKLLGHPLEFYFF